MMESTGINEFYEIIKLQQTRNVIQKSQFIPPKFAIADRCLWQYEINYGEQNIPGAIYALSPSDASVLIAQMGIAKLIPQVGETKRRVPSLLPNHAAVVLLFKIGEDSILLGSDLEETGQAETGWMAIISSGTRPEGKASFFKIPHHGSVTAENPHIWSLMLKPQPISALTPFAAGKVFLPTNDDVDRICNNTDQAFSTGVPKHPKAKSRPKMVEKQIKEMGLKLRPVYCSPGQVRVRGRYINDRINWIVQLLGDAIPLREMYN